MLPLPNAPGADWPLMIASGCWVILIGLGRDIGCQIKGWNRVQQSTLCIHRDFVHSMGIVFGYVTLYYDADDCESIILMRLRL